MTILFAPLQNRVDFRLCIRAELVDRDDIRHPVLLNGFDMLFQVFDAFQNGRNIFFFQLIRRNTAVQLQRSGRCDNDDRIRCV